MIRARGLEVFIFYYNFVKRVRGNRSVCLLLGVQDTEERVQDKQRGGQVFCI